MKKENLKLIIVEGIILLLVVGIGITFAYLESIGKQGVANTFTTGCLNVAIEKDGTSINVDDAVPVTDIEGLKQEGYTFTIKNNCDSKANGKFNTTF